MARPGLGTAGVRSGCESFRVAVDKIANSGAVRAAEAVRGEEKRPRIPLEPVRKRSAGARARAGNVDQRMSPCRIRTHAFQQHIRNAHPMLSRPAGSRRTNAIFRRKAEGEDASALTWIRHRRDKVEGKSPLGSTAARYRQGRALSLQGRL